MNTSSTYIEVKISSNVSLHDLLTEMMALDGIQIEQVVFKETLIRADEAKPESQYVITICVPDSGYRWPLKALREIVNNASTENEVTMFDFNENTEDGITSYEKCFYNV